MVDAFRAYIVIVRMWVRAACQYRVSLALLTFASFAAGGLEALALLIIFGTTTALGGFDLADVLFLYGTSATSLGIADLLVGQVDRLGGHVRLGDVDVMLVRPVPVLVQLAAEQFSPRRAGRVLQAAIVLGAGIHALPVQWTPWRAALVPLMILSGVLIYGALWVVGAAFLFAAPDTAEIMNSFTYGGNYLVQHPMTIYGRHVVAGFTFIVPLAFVNWEPTLLLLGRPDPLGLPAFAGLLSPVVALAVVAVAAIAWRRGMAGYLSTGS